MAGLTWSGGVARIRFYDAAGTQKSITLGRNKEAAERGRIYILRLAERLKTGGSIDKKTADWLADIESLKLKRSLVKHGLVSAEQVGLQDDSDTDEQNPDEPDGLRLFAYLDGFLKTAETKAGDAAAKGTKTKWGASMNRLKEFFEFNPFLASISKNDAHEFDQWLGKYRIKLTRDVTKHGKIIDKNTRRKCIADCKTFFNAAEHRDLILKCPFRGIASASVPSKRKIYIDKETIQTIMDHCPCNQWRLLVALWRFGGLRKTEVLTLKWKDVDWAVGKLTVDIKKTKHHEGKSRRHVPLRDVFPYLTKVASDVTGIRVKKPPGNSRLITIVGETNSNLDKPFAAILEDAGIEQWSMLFHSLRMSCATDWIAENISVILVAAWGGHSVSVLEKSYFKTTDEQFRNHTAGDAI